MLLSIITVAFRNLEGIVKTHASLAHLAQAGDISFEWIVVDGGSSDGTSAFLEGLSGEHRLRFVSEPDNGIYDAMNKASRWRAGGSRCSSTPGIFCMRMRHILSAS